MPPTVNAPARSPARATGVVGPQDCRASSNPEITANGNSPMAAIHNPVLLDNPANPAANPHGGKTAQKHLLVHPSRPIHATIGKAKPKPIHTGTES